MLSKHIGCQAIATSSDSESLTTFQRMSSSSYSDVFQQVLWDAWLPAKLPSRKQQHKMQRQESCIDVLDSVDPSAAQVENNVSWLHVLRAVTWHNGCYFGRGRQVVPPSVHALCMHMPPCCYHVPINTHETGMLTMILRQAQNPRLISALLLHQKSH